MLKNENGAANYHGDLWTGANPLDRTRIAVSRAESGIPARSGKRTRLGRKQTVTARLNEQRNVRLTYTNEKIKKGFG